MINNMAKRKTDPVKELVSEIKGRETDVVTDDVYAKLIGDDEQAPATFEIAPGATVEEVKALFFDASAFVEPPTPLYRLDRSGHRYYYHFDDNGNPVFYPSITTLISQTVPTSEFLIKWISDIGYDRAESYKNERAHYGTFMHGEYAELLISRVYDLDKLKERLIGYVQSKGLPLDFVDYADDLRKNILSLAQFIIDVDLTPLAIEIPMVHPEMKFAATLDLPCEMTFKGKRFRAIIDFKSGKNFYEANEIQLHGQKEIWNHHFPDRPVERVFNWRPKDWRIAPTYELKEQTNSVNSEKLKYIVAIAQIEDKKVDNMLTLCNGVVNLENGITDNYKSYTLAELVKSKTTKKEKTPDKKTTIKADELKADDTKPAEKPRRGRKPGATATKAKKGTNTRAKKESPAKPVKSAKKEAAKKLLDDDLNI